MSTRNRVYFAFAFIIGTAIYLAGFSTGATSQTIARAEFNALSWLSASWIVTGISFLLSPMDEFKVMVKKGLPITQSMRNQIVVFSLLYLIFLVVGVGGAAWQIKGLL